MFAWSPQKDAFYKSHLFIHKQNVHPRNDPDDITVTLDIRPTSKLITTAKH